jgi:hypothetical protein
LVVVLRFFGVFPQTLPRSFGNGFCRSLCLFLGSLLRG